MKDLLKDFGEVLQEEEFIQVYLQNKGLYLFKDFCVNNPHKIDCAVLFIHFLVKNNTELKIQTIQTLRTIFGSNFNEFIRLLACWSQFPPMDDNEKIYFKMLYYYAYSALDSPRVSTVLAGIRIIDSICVFNWREIA